MTLLTDSNPEMLSLQCESCDWATRSRPDFYQHQAEQHHVTKGLDGCYLRAVELDKCGGQKRKIEEITLEDSDDDSEDCERKEEVAEKDDFKLEKVNDMIGKRFSGLFQNLDLILDGILLETDGGEEQMDEGPEGFERKTSPCEEEIHQSFDEVRTIFHEMIQKPSSLLSGAESQRSKKDEKCKPPTSISSETKENRGKLLKCQFPNCNYVATKAARANGEAAKHIRSHGLTSRDLKSWGLPFKTEGRNKERQK